VKLFTVFIFQAEVKAEPGSAWMVSHVPDMILREESATLSLAKVYTVPSLSL